MLTYYKTILITICLLVTCSNGTRGISAYISEQLEENDSAESILSINKSPELDDDEASQLDVKLQNDESPATALSTTPYPLTSSTTKKSRSPVRKLVSFVFRTTTKKPKTTKTTRPPLFTLPKRTTRPPLFTFKTTKASTTKTTKTTKPTTTKTTKPTTSKTTKPTTIKTTKPTTSKTTKTSTIKTTKTTKPPLFTLPPILQTTTKAPLIIRTTMTTTFPTTSTTTTAPTTPTTTVSTVQPAMSPFSSTLTSTDPPSSSTLRTNEIQTISTSVSTNRLASSEAIAPSTNPGTVSDIASKTPSWTTDTASTTNAEEHQSTTVPQPVPSSHLFSILMITSGIVVSSMIIVIPCVYYKFLSARLYQTRKKPYIEKEPEFNELKI